MRERASDIRDIGRCVLAILAGADLKKIEVPEGAILVAEDLTPSDTVALDPARVAGFCTRTGGATSHVAILARSLGIPAICGISQRALSLPDDRMVIMDASQGLLNIKPSPQDLVEAQAEQKRLGLNDRKQIKPVPINLVSPVTKLELKLWPISAMKRMRAKR